MSRSIDRTSELVRTKIHIKITTKISQFGITLPFPNNFHNIAPMPNQLRIDINLKTILIRIGYHNLSFE